MEREKIVILHAKAYSFANKDNDLIEGIKLKYIMNGTLEPFKVDNKEKGYLIAEGSISLDNISQIASIPGVYYPSYVKNVNAKGQVVQKLVNVDFIEPLQAVQQEIKK